MNKIEEMDYFKGENNDKAFSCSAVKPLTTKQFAKGYIEILDGNSQDELFVHVYAYGRLDKSFVKRFVEPLTAAMPEGSSVAGEYIPELMSICLVVSKQNLELSKNLIIKKISEACAKAFGDK